MLQTGVEIVNPGGTGSLALVISARPEPLPPSRSFIVRSPSALPSPKKYTYLPGLASFAILLSLSFDAFLAIRLLLRLRNDFGNICYAQDELLEALHEAHPCPSQGLVFHHHEDFGEESIDCGAELGCLDKCAAQIFS